MWAFKYNYKKAIFKLLNSVPNKISISFNHITGNFALTKSS